MIPEITEINFPEYATLHAATISFEEMGERVITTQVKIDGDVVPDFSTGWELEYRGETFVLNTHTPQATKNDTTRCSLIDLTFESAAMAMLKRYYFVEMSEIETGTYIIDKYVASLRLNAQNFFDAFNRVLNYYFGGEITVTKQAGLDMPTEVKDVELNYTYIWNALTAFYEQYGLVWRIEKRNGAAGYNIVLGDTAQSISHTFQYGYNGGLKSIQRQLEDAEIFNQIFGRGGEKNLPYRYFKRVDENNPAWAADPDAIYELRNVYFGRLLDINFRWYVRGWMQNSHRDKTWEHAEEPYYYPSYSLDASSPYYDAFHRGQTDTEFNPVEYIQDDESIAEYGIWQGKLDDNDDIFPTIQGAQGGIDEVVAVGPIEDADASEDTSVIVETLSTTTIHLQTQYSSEHANNYLKMAIDSGTYQRISPQSGTRYQIALQSQPFSIPAGYTCRASIPWRSTADPSSINPLTVTSLSMVAERIGDGARFPVEAMPGGAAYRINIVVKFEADADSQPIKYDITIPYMLNNVMATEYNPYNTFTVWVKNIFNTTKGANESEVEYMERVWSPILGDRAGNEAKVVFSDGALSASSDYEFTIVSFPEFDQSKSIGGINSEWKMTLARSDAEFDATGKMFPNETSAKPVAGDHFFFIGIDIPFQYVVLAEERLNAAKQEALSSRAYANPTWVVELDKNRIQTKVGAETATLFEQLNVGKVMNIYDARFSGGQTLGLGIRSLTITWDDNTAMCPNVQVVLSENVMSATAGYSETVKALYARVTVAESNVLQIRRASYASTPTQYLSSVQKDEADDRIDFLNGIGFGRDGVNGTIDGEGNAELRSLRLREFLEVPELRYNRVSIDVGNSWRAPGGGIIDHVEIDPGQKTGIIFLHLEDREIGHVVLDDICMGIYHDGINESSNAVADVDDSKGGFHFAGFYTTYFRVTEILAADNSVFRYALRPEDVLWDESYHPCAGMHFVGYGNFDTVNHADRQTSRYSTRTYERYLKNVSGWEFGADNIAAQFGDLSNLATIDPQRFAGMTGYSAYLENIFMTGYFRQTTNPPAKRIDIDTGNTTVLNEGSEEPITMVCKAMQGWEELTVSSWSIARDSGDRAADEEWDEESGGSFDGTFDIYYGDLATVGVSTIFTITATLGDNTTITGNLVITAVRNGQNGYNSITLQLFTRDATLAAAGITAQMVYIFSTNSLRNIPNGWSRNIPAADGNPLYETTAVIVSRSNSVSSIATNLWSTPVKVAEDGAAGPAGYNKATIYLYKRGTTAPSRSNITTPLYYRFSEPKMLYTNAEATTEASEQSNLDGWSLTLPTSGSDPIWVTAAIVASNTDVDDIGRNEWVEPAQLAANGQDGAAGQPGAAGAHGINTATVFLYKRTATYPSAHNITGTVYYKFSDGGLYLDADCTTPVGNDRILNSWKRSIPEGGPDANPCYIIQAIALSSDSCDAIETSDWSDVRALVENGEQGPEGPTGPQGLQGPTGPTGPAGYNTATIYLYKRLSAPESDFTLPIYIFYKFSEPKKLYSDQDCTIEATSAQLSGWSLTIPTDSTYPVYVTAASISSDRSSMGIQSYSWVTPAKMTENGTPGINSAIVFLYKRASSAPSAHGITATLYYKFADGNLYVKSGNTYTLATDEQRNDWLKEIPSGDDPCYFIQAAALSTEDYDAVTEWSSPTKLVENGTPGEDGEDAVMATLDHYTDIIAYDSEGTKISSDAIVNAALMKGAATLPDTPFTWIPSSGISGESSGVRNDRYTVRGISGDSGTVTASAAYNGINAKALFLYKRYASTPSKGIDKALYYKFSDGNYYVKSGDVYTLANENTDLVQWKKSIPTGDNPCYVMHAVALGADEYAEIPYTNWSSPRSINEENDTDGRDGAVVLLYKRASSASGTVSLVDITLTLYYKYSTPTKIYSDAACTTEATSISSWKMTPPDGSYPLFVTAAVVTSDATTDSIAEGEWMPPVKVKRYATYSAVIAIKKNIFVNQYEIQANPQSITYNATTGTKSAPQITFTVYKTTMAADGSIARAAMRTIDSSKYKLYCDATNVTLSYQGSYQYSIPSTIPDSVLMTLNRLNGDDPETLLARVLVPIVKTSNGADGITYRRSVWAEGKLYRNDVADPTSNLRPADGLTVIDIVYNKYIAMLDDNDLRIYQCKTTHPSKEEDMSGGQLTSSRWDPINQTTTPFATPLLLATRIIADYIDVIDLAANTGFINALTVNKLTVKNGDSIIAKIGDMSDYTVDNVAGKYPFWIGGATPANAVTRIDSTGKLTTTNIVATGGTIGGFNIANSHLGVTMNSSNPLNGMSLYSEYISFYYNDTDASYGAKYKTIIGSNAGVLGQRYLADFSVEGTGSDLTYGQEGYGIKCSVTGYSKNAAIYCTNGLFAGLRPYTKVFESGANYLDDKAFSVIVNHDNSNTTVYLPTNPQDGQTYFIHHTSTYSFRINYQGGKQIYYMKDGQAYNEHICSNRDIAIITYFSLYQKWILHLIHM